MNKTEGHPPAQSAEPLITSHGRAVEDDFQAMFTACYPAVVRTVHYVVQDLTFAEEIAQDAFIQLLLHWKKVSQYDRPDLWVRRVAIRRAQRERSRELRRGERERASTRQLHASSWHGPDPEVMDAIGSLPLKQRAIVVLFYFEDRSMGEIAPLVGCSVSTGWSQLHNARRKLALLLAEEVTGDVR